MITRMASPGARILVAVLVSPLALALFPACTKATPSTAAESSMVPSCSLPPRAPFPSWIPGDLPFPAGTYAEQELAGSGGYQRAVLVISGSLEDLNRYVLTAWPRAGWALGSGDSEGSEIENQFGKPPAVGAFKAQAQPCSPGYSLMLLIFAADRSRIGAPPPGQGG